MHSPAPSPDSTQQGIPLIRIISIVLLVVSAIVFWKNASKTSGPDEATTQETAALNLGKTDAETEKTGEPAESTNGFVLKHYKPADQQDLMGWLNLRGFAMQIETSGQQLAFGTRFAIYREGKLVQSTPWHLDRSETGRARLQNINLLYRIDEKQIELWRRLEGAAGKVSLSLVPELPKFRIFIQKPRIVNQFQIPLAAALSPGNHVLEDKDFDPQHAHLLLVMELMERAADNPLP